jgi:hypothetical protein
MWIEHLIVAQGSTTFKMIADIEDLDDWCERPRAKRKNCCGPSSDEKKTIMQVQVERCADHLGVERPVRFRFDAREIEIVENVDRWYGSDYCYFKIKGNDGNLYILRFDEGRAEWELTMFQSERPTGATPVPCKVE